MVPLTQKVIFLLIPDIAVLGHIYLCKAPESNTIDLGAIQINYIIIINTPSLDV